MDFENDLLVSKVLPGNTCHGIVIDCLGRSREEPGSITESTRIRSDNSILSRPQWLLPALYMSDIPKNKS